MNTVEIRCGGDYQIGSSKKPKVEKVVKGDHVAEIEGVVQPRNNEVTENQFVPLGVCSAYRNQVLNEMRKLYNREEYYKLKHDVEARKPIERHMDLRNGATANGRRLGTKYGRADQPINLYFVTRTKLRSTNELCSRTIAWNSCEEEVVIFSHHFKEMGVTGFHCSIFLLDLIKLFLQNGKSLEKIEIMHKES